MSAALSALLRLPSVRSKLLDVRDRLNSPVKAKAILDFDVKFSGERGIMCASMMAKQSATLSLGAQLRAGVYPEDKERMDDVIMMS